MHEDLSLRIFVRTCQTGLGQTTIYTTGTSFCLAATMACASGSNCSTKGSSLGRLIEEINFQRAKEMRQLLKDDGGFVMLHGAAYWTDLFVRHFLMEEDCTAQESDDLLFFIRKRHLSEAKKSLPKYETLLEVQRRDSKKLPLGDPEIDWEETIYANLILQRFDYFVTLAVCSRTSPKELQVLRRHTERVWASPSRRLMSDKGTSEDITYPNICFMLDNFDQAFTDIVVRAGEMVSVELLARDRSGALQSVIFLGSVRYDALRRVYDARTSLTTRMAQRVTFGLYSGDDAARMEFVRVRGPLGKGHAELAVTRPPGEESGSPTDSEPGRTLAERAAAPREPAGRAQLQRRASDPSGGLHSPYRRSGADAGSFPEDAAADSAEDSAGGTEAGGQGDGAGQSAAGSPDSPAAAEKAVDDTGLGGSRGSAGAPAGTEDPSSPAPDKSASMDACHSPVSVERAATNRQADLKDSVVEERTVERTHRGLKEGADDNVEEGTDGAAGERTYREADDSIGRNVTELTDCDVEEAAGRSADERTGCDRASEGVAVESGGRGDGILGPATATSPTQPCVRRLSCGAAVRSHPGPRSPALTPGMLYRHACGQSDSADHRCACARTPDGTVVHFGCPVQQAFLRRRELDEGVCNPIWTMRGLSQTLHLWRETQRTSSLPLSTYLTYVMLPWHTIITDLIAKENRQDPILSF